MPIDTLIHGAEVVLPHGGGVQKLDLAIEEGRVSAHLAPGDESLIKARTPSMLQAKPCFQASSILTLTWASATPKQITPRKPQLPPCTESPPC